jgi:hypothetical protein
MSLEHMSLARNSRHRYRSSKICRSFAATNAVQKIFGGARWRERARSTVHPSPSQVSCLEWADCDGNLFQFFEAEKVSEILFTISNFCFESGDTSFAQVVCEEIKVEQSLKNFEKVFVLKHPIEKLKVKWSLQNLLRQYSKLIWDENQVNKILFQSCAKKSNLNILNKVLEDLLNLASRRVQSFLPSKR